VRYQFSVGDVLFVKVLVEFPFALSKEDKRSLAKILSGGDRTAARWSREGADLVYRAGDMQVSFECKAFRQKVARNLSAFRWGRRRIVSSPDVMGENWSFVALAYPFSMLHRFFGRVFQKRRSRKISLLSASVTWPTSGCSPG
jgi:hypothetical protein